LTFIYLNLDSGVAMHKKGLCKKVSSCGTNRKTCYHISGRSVQIKFINKKSILAKYVDSFKEKLERGEVDNKNIGVGIIR
jgi:hypothetical protein